MEVILKIYSTVNKLKLSYTTCIRETNRLFFLYKGHDTERVKGKY